MLRNLGEKAKKAERVLMTASTSIKNQALCNIAKALTENSDYTLEPLPLPDCFPVNESGMLALVPGEYDTDGFFIARLRRK